MGTDFLKPAILGLMLFLGSVVWAQNQTPRQKFEAVPANSWVHDAARRLWKSDVMDASPTPDIDSRVLGAAVGSTNRYEYAVFLARILERTDLNSNAKREDGARLRDLVAALKREFTLELAHLGAHDPMPRRAIQGNGVKPPPRLLITPTIMRGSNYRPHAPGEARVFIGPMPAEIK